MELPCQAWKLLNIEQKGDQYTTCLLLKRIRYETCTMGIPGLQTFIDDFFTEWRSGTVSGKLVVDGNQLCYQFYRSFFKWSWGVKLEWVYGGQYPEYRAAVEGFFQYLQQAGITPTVVFDGFLHMKGKFETVYKRYEKKAADRHKALLGMPHSHPSNRDAWTLPPLAYQVFHATLQVMGVKQLIADGDGDTMITQVANELNCPVLSKDSDFFMTHLPQGYIPLDRFYRGLPGNPIIEAEVFHLREFNHQFGLQAVKNLHLVIPAAKGNDYLKETHISIDSVSTENHMKRLIDYIKQFQSLEALFTSISSGGQHTPEKHAHSNDQVGSNDTREKPEDGENTSEEASDDHTQAKRGDDTQSNDEDVQQQLRSNYQRAVEMYNNVEKCKPNERVAGKIPQWLADKYYCGEFSSRYLLQASLLGKQLTVSSETSKLLRQYAYSILGVGVSGAKFVHEYPATGGKVSEVRVEAVDSIQGSPSQRLPRISEVEGLSLTDRTRLLFQMLDCDQKAIESLEDKWRLVIASVVFWARKERPNETLVKALLVCFLLCHKSQRSTERHHLPDLSADSWLETQSAFIAWQCTYLDSIGLNELLMKPLKSPSAAFLFDGKLAMGLAAETNIDDRVTEFGINRDLYKRLLDAVTSQYEALAAWKTVRESKPKAKPAPHGHRAGPEPHSRRAGPDLGPHSRRVGLEPHSRRAGPESHSRRAGPESHSRRAGLEPHSRRAGLEPHSRRAGPEPHSRRAGPESHSRRAGLEPHSRRAGLEPQAARGKQKQNSESQTKTINRYELLPDDCDD